MRLAIFLEGKNRADVASQFGISEPYLSQLSTGKRKPGRSLALRIEELTEGLVGVRDWEDETHAIR